MGSVRYGQLRNPHARRQVKVISASSYHVAILTSVGSVYTCGKGENGQLGLGDTEDRPISVNDQSACSGCRLSFGFTRKKHNCYDCGLYFCRACSSKKVINASLAPSKSNAFRLHRLPDLTEDRGETTMAQGPLLTLGQSCYKKSMPSGRKDWKNQQERHQHLEDSSSSMLGGMPQWGKVSCPAQFRINCKENLAGHVSSSKNKVATIASPNIESPVAAFNFSSAESDTTKFDKMLIEEVQRLRAELKRLEEQCELKNHKIQECQQKIEKSWFVAKEEAAKSKAAKEVIKALAVRPA
ncbi:Putative E3 ubiquitin-protein ligase [Arachis hypogaea]|nr:Putative E3 ubiquitin-protein ligase [Arachis hypogaea]